VVDENEREDLIQNPGAEKWASAELEVRLQRSLPKSYDILLGIIASMSDCIESLKKNFGLDNAATRVRIDQVGSMQSSRSNLQIVS
jgi:hypothetical protein